MMKFYLLIEIEAESKEQAREYQESMAGSNDGSEQLANATLLTEDDIREGFATSNS